MRHRAEQVPLLTHLHLEVPIQNTEGLVRAGGGDGPDYQASGVNSKKLSNPAEVIGRILEPAGRGT